MSEFLGNPVEHIFYFLQVVTKLSTLEKRIDIVELLFNDVHVKNYFSAKFVNASWASPTSPAPLGQRPGPRGTSTPAPATLNLNKPNVSLSLLTSA